MRRHVGVCDIEDHNHSVARPFHECIPRMLDHNVGIEIENQVDISKLFKQDLFDKVGLVIGKIPHSSELNELELNMWSYDIDVGCMIFVQLFKPRRFAAAITNHHATSEACMHKGVRERRDAVEIAAFGNCTYNTGWAC